MIIDMNNDQVGTLEQVREVVAGTQALRFKAAQKDAGRYAWIGTILKRLDYRRLERAEHGTDLPAAFAQL
jgi:hypothetical protein